MKGNCSLKISTTSDRGIASLLPSYSLNNFSSNKWSLAYRDGGDIFLGGRPRQSYTAERIKSIMQIIGRRNGKTSAESTLRLQINTMKVNGAYIALSSITPASIMR